MRRVIWHHKIHILNQNTFLLNISYTWRIKNKSAIKKVRKVILGIISKTESTNKKPVKFSKNDILYFKINQPENKILKKIFVTNDKRLLILIHGKHY